jgi:hypothetical protein
MSSFSDYAENKILDLVFRGQAWTPPATLYISLHTGTTLDDGGGTEVSGGSYARVAIASNMTNWSGTQGAGTTVASSGITGIISNNVAITFPAPTGNWGTIVGYGLRDAASGGNLIAHGTLAASKTITAGDLAPLFAIGQLTFTLA